MSDGPDQPPFDGDWNHRSGPGEPAPWGSQPPNPQPQWGQQPPPAQPPQWGGQQPPTQPPQWGGQPSSQPLPGQPPQWSQQPTWGAPGPPGGYSGYVAPPKPGIIPLRPLGLGEILDGAFQAARKNAAAMFGSALLFQAGVVALMALVTGVSFGVGTNIESFFQPDGMPTAAGVTFGLGVIAAFTLFTVLNVASVMVLQGALVLPVSRAVLNQHTGFREMWSLVKGRIWPLLGLCLLVLGASVVAAGVILGLAIFLIATTNIDAWLLVFPVLAGAAAFLWIGVKISLAPAALVLERVSIFASIARSWRLVRGHWWRTFGILLLATIIVSIVTSVVTVPVQIVVSIIGTLTVDGGSAEEMVIMTLVTSGISTLISSLFAAIGYAFQAGVTALIYVDLRMRHEGFDLVLMKEAETAVTTAGHPGRTPGNNQPPLAGPGR